MSGPTPDESDGIDCDLAESVRGRVKGELDPGERLLWAGQPQPRPEPVSAGMVGCGAFGGLLAVASLALLTEAFRTTSADNSIAFRVWGVIALVATIASGLICLSGQRQRRSRRETLEGSLYALTDRRAILWLPQNDRKGLAVHSIPRGQVARVHRVEYPDGTGDVRFTMTRDTYDHWNVPTGFHGIPDVRRVEEQARRTLIVES